MPLRSRACNFMITHKKALPNKFWLHWQLLIEGGMELSTLFSKSKTVRAPSGKRSEIGRAAYRSFRRHWQLYLLVIPPVLYFIIFKYLPMANAVLAFKNYNVVKGIWGVHGSAHSISRCFSQPGVRDADQKYAVHFVLSIDRRVSDPDSASAGLERGEECKVQKPCRWSPMRHISSPRWSWCPSSCCSCPRVLGS